MKVSVIMGTRPEAIKLAPVILALKQWDQVHCHVCVTAQHREMLDQVLSVFEIVPDVDLNLMRKGQNLAELTARSLEALDAYFVKQAPDFVLFQGDTTTVLAGALAAFYRGVPIGHVEAGLRTRNMQSPWPEEANRVLTSRIASLHFAPTQISYRNLRDEKVPDDKIIVTGNTVIDALLLASEKVRRRPPSLGSLDQIVARSNMPLVLITGHRRESFGDKLESICMAIADLANLFPDTHFVYPVHMNPAVRDGVAKVLGPSTGRCLFENVHLIEPLPYFEFVALMQRSTLIITDSGGIQEEAPSLGKPTLVTRDTTERPEAIEAGCARLVGADRTKIVAEVARLLSDSTYYKSATIPQNPYGDGKASARICEAILQYFGLNCVTEPVGAFR